MLIDFIDEAYEGWVLLYKLRRHSSAVKARLNRMRGKVVQTSSKLKTHNAALDPYLTPIKQEPIIRRNPWERGNATKGNIEMWDSLYRLLKQFDWSIDEEWQYNDSSLRLKHVDYPTVRPLLFHLYKYSKDYQLVDEIREFVTKPVA